MFYFQYFDGIKSVKYAFHPYKKKKKKNVMER